VRALLLLLLFSCGSGEKANSDGGSTALPPADAGDGANATPCMIDGDCAPGEACTGALPGVAATGRCAARRDPGIAVECISP
jgi:hypothetical protein